MAMDMATIPGFFKPGHTGERRSPHQHFRDGICLAALRAFTAAELRQEKPGLALREVALRVGCVRSWKPRRPGQPDEPLSALEARRLLVRLVQRVQIDQLIDQLLQTTGLGELPPEIKQQIAANTHREARKQGLTKTDTVDLSRLIGGGNFKGENHDQT